LIISNDGIDRMAMVRQKRNLWKITPYLSASQCVVPLSNGQHELAEVYGRPFSENDLVNVNRFLCNKYRKMLKDD